MFADKARLKVGINLVNIGEYIEDSAHEIEHKYDPNRQTPIRRTTEVAGMVVGQLGYAILPELRDIQKVTRR